MSGYFESAGDQQKAAAATVELAFCYYREGELNESRIMIREALEKLMPGGNITARAFLKLSALECSAGRYHEAFKILSDNAAIFRRLSNHTIKGGYHAEMAIILPHLATPEKRDDSLTQAVTHFQKADHEFKLARNNVYRADIKNNVALILITLSRYKRSAQISGRSAATLS